MRARLTLVLAVLAVLALAGFHAGDAPLVVTGIPGTASGQLAGQPDPKPALPAVGNAAVMPTPTGQSTPLVEWPRPVNPASRGLAARVQSSAAPDGFARPRSFPLLI